MPVELPQRYLDFAKSYPEIHEAYEALGEHCHAAGPLDEKTRRLIKLGIAVASRTEGGVHAQVRQAMNAGITAEEIRHCVLLALPTIGWPATIAALTWADDSLTDLSPA